MFSPLIAVVAFLSLLTPPYARAADCQLPWGPVLKNGDSTIAWNYSHPPGGLSCRSEVRSCMDGFLTGSFTSRSCNQPARALMKARLPNLFKK